MWMLWGPELTFLCNDAYLPTTGLKRDWVLGARSDRIWAEIWNDVGPRIEHVLRTGEATWTSSYASISNVTDLARKPTIHFLIRR